MTPQSKPLLAWRERIAHEASVLDGAPFVRDHPVELRLIFYAPRPKSASRRASAHELALSRRVGDIDKLCRGALDALQGVWLADDSQVVKIVAEKRVCALEERPGVEVELWSI